MRFGSINFPGCSDINEPHSERVWFSRATTIDQVLHLLACCWWQISFNGRKNSLHPDLRTIPRSRVDRRAQSIIIKYSLERKWDDNTMNKLHFLRVLHFFYNFRSAHANCRIVFGREAFGWSVGYVIYVVWSRFRFNNARFVIENDPKYQQSLPCAPPEVCE